VKRWVVVKKSRQYIGGNGSDGKTYQSDLEALEVAVELSQRNPVGYEVVPFKPYHREE
jgi:hypothetical protein